MHKLVISNKLIYIPVSVLVLQEALCVLPCSGITEVVDLFIMYMMNLKLQLKSVSIDFACMHT